MVNNQKYNRYKFLYENIKLDSDDIENTLSDCFLEIAFSKCNFSTSEAIKDLFFVYNFHYLLELMQIRRTVFTDAHFRNDHFLLINSILKSNTDFGYVSFSRVPRKFVLSFNNIFKALKMLFKHKNKFLNFGEAYFFFRKVVSVLNCHELLKKTFTNKTVHCEKYVAFHSQYGLESILIPFFKKRGILTYTLSHGLTYCKYKIRLPIDIINAVNLQSDYVIVWGESSKSDLIQNYSFNENRILVGGNPKYPRKEITINRKFKKCIILLGRVEYESSNLLLLKILSSYATKNNMKLTVKLHPTLDNNRYANFCKDLGITIYSHKISLQDILMSNEFDFAVVNNSTAYYEALYYGLLCFRFKLEENEEYLGLEDRFETESQFNELIIKFSTLNEEDLESCVNDLLVSTLGMGVNNYTEILN